MGASCGRSCFGFVADDLLAYQTFKVVRIKDHRLGGVYYGLIVLIILFIVGYEILYANSHMERRDVSGTARLALRQPTMNRCNPRRRDCKSNFTSPKSLPYCKAYQGNASQVPASFRHECIFADSDTLFPHGHDGNSMLLATRITTTHETRRCFPGDVSCDNEFERDQDQVQYVADIEKYSVLIQHSFGRDTLSGNSDQLQGYYLECDRSFGKSLMSKLFGAASCKNERRWPIECWGDECEFLPEKQAKLQAEEEKLEDQANQADVDVAHTALAALASTSSHREGRSCASRASLVGSPSRLQRASPWRAKIAAAAGVAGAATIAARIGQLGGAAWSDEDERYLGDDVFAVPEGDVFTVGKLLSLAGVNSLDLVKDQINETYRHAGAIINVAVTYTNLVPFKSTFGGADITYEYHVTQRPMNRVSDHFVKSVEGSMRRTLERRSGILFVINVQGVLGFPSVVNTLVMLAEAASLLAIATLLTDKIAIYMMARADDYYKSKYEET